MPTTDSPRPTLRKVAAVALSTLLAFSLTAPAQAGWLNGTISCPANIVGHVAVRGEQRVANEWMVLSLAGSSTRAKGARFTYHRSSHKSGS